MVVVVVIVFGVVAVVVPLSILVDLVVLVRPDLLRHLLVQLGLEHRPHLAHEPAEVVLVLVGPSKYLQDEDGTNSASCLL